VPTRQQESPQAVIYPATSAGICLPVLAPGILRTDSNYGLKEKIRRLTLCKVATWWLPNRSYCKEQAPAWLSIVRWFPAPGWAGTCRRVCKE